MAATAEDDKWRREQDASALHEHASPLCPLREEIREPAAAEGASNAGVLRIDRGVEDGHAQAEMEFRVEDQGHPGQQHHRTAGTSERTGGLGQLDPQSRTDAPPLPRLEGRRCDGENDEIKAEAGSQNDPEASGS